MADKVDLTEFVNRMEELPYIEIFYNLYDPTLAFRQYLTQGLMGKIDFINRENGKIWSVRPNHLIHTKIKPPEMRKGIPWYLYVVELFYIPSNMTLYKVGITNRNNIKIRFWGMNTNYILKDILKTVEYPNLSQAYNAESKIKNHIKHMGYNMKLDEPLGKGGDTEVFSKLPDERTLNKWIKSPYAEELSSLEFL